MSSTVSIAVHGAAGRMGQAILRLALERADVRVVAAAVKRDSLLVGRPLRDLFGGIADDLSFVDTLDTAAKFQVLIDFSTPPAFDVALATAVSQRSAFVSGTTGLADAQYAALERAARTIPVLWSANFSIGVAVLTRLVSEAARALRAWDCEIVEVHHRNKKDAPSGTALALGRVVAAARGVDLEKVSRFDRSAVTHARDPSEIGFAVVRGGDVVGEHTVLFAGDGERIELTHRATRREIFARGALESATWLAARQPGLYALTDILDQ